MKYPRVFRARMSDKMMDDIRQAALDMKMSQQQVVRSGVQLWLDELDRVQGVTPQIGHRALEPEVKVATRPAPGKKAQAVSEPMLALRRYAARLAEGSHLSDG